MPKIIRSSTVNIDSAQPIVVRAIFREEEEAQPTPPPEPEVVERAIDQEYANVYANAGSVVDEMLEKARTDAGTIVENAREETRRVLQDALKEGLEQGFEQGYAQGYDKGMADGRRELDAKKAEAAEQIEGILDSLRIERQNIIRNMERDVVTLVFDIVDKVLDVAMDRSDDWIVSRVRLALQQLENDASAVVRVARENLERVTAVAGSLAQEGGHNAQLRIVADDRLERGAFVVDTDSGSIDAGVGTKRARAAELLLERS